MSRLRKVDPEAAASVPDLVPIIGLRNLLVHGYAEVQSDRVWRAATEHVGDLIEALSALLQPYE